MLLPKELSEVSDTAIEFPVFCFSIVPALFPHPLVLLSGQTEGEKNFFISSCQTVPQMHKGFLDNLFPNSFLIALCHILQMLFTAPLDCFIRLSHINFLSAKGVSTYAAADTTAEHISV